MADTVDLRLLSMRCGECNQRFGADAMFCPFDGARLAGQAWDPSGDPLVGKTIDGRYEVTGVLGEGGMGTVYRVRHTSLDRAFALKMLRRDLASDPELSARFMREARATASVKHPNVVAITDFGQHEGVPFFVMELLAGQTLARSIKSSGPLPLPIAVKVALKIAAGMGAAHDQKIVHRDLKPENVFVLLEGATGELDVRIVDFGAAMIVGASRVTKTGVVFGTPHYMSPEQASGQPVDHRADIYALGVILYEMFTGKVPFEADTYMGVLTQHMFVQPVPPSQVSAAAQKIGALEQVTLRALAKRPEDRFASMYDLAEAIGKSARFEPDGTLRLSPAEPAAVASQPRVATSTEPLLAAPGSVTRADAHHRRARARSALLYGAVVVGVAALTLGAIRLVARPASPSPTEAPSPEPVASAPSPPAPPPPAPATTPPDEPAPSPVAQERPPPPPPTSGATRPAARPATRPSKPKAAPGAVGVGDFKDPWSR